MEVCPQCNITLNTANCRLVRDACGHVKCRLCLVLEEDGCLTCSKSGKINKNVTTVKYNSDGSLSDDNVLLESGDDEASEQTYKNKKKESNKEKNYKTKENVRKKTPIIAEKHIVVIPGHPVRYQCTVCNKSFSAKYSIRYHNFCSSEKKPFQCIICKKGFVTKSHYEYHLRVHSGSEPFECNTCGKRFKQKAKLTQHIKSHTGERSFICQECGKAFSGADGLQCHRRTHTGEKPYVCKTCSKAFSEASNYKKHLLTHSGDKPFMCEECGKSFGLKHSLDLHLFIHSRERNHVCATCNRGFAMRKDLKRHWIVHSEDRPYNCSMCGMKFRRKDNLERHIRNTHLDTIAPEIQNQAKTTPKEVPSPDIVNDTAHNNTVIQQELQPLNKSSQPEELSIHIPEKSTEVVSSPDRTEKLPTNIIKNKTPTTPIRKETAEHSVHINSVGSSIISSDTQPKESFRAVPVINRSSNFSNIIETNSLKTDNAAKKDNFIVEGKNCVRTITRASSGKSLPQNTETVIKPKLECFRVLERPEIFKIIESQRTNQPSLRMLLNDVECSNNNSTVLNLTQDVQNSRSESLFQDSLAMLENARYDRTVPREFSDSNLPDMYPSDFLLSSYEMNRTSYSRKSYSEEVGSQYPVSNVSYDHFMGSPYLVSDIGNTANNPVSYVQNEEDVSGRLKLLADVAGTKDPSVQVTQVIVGAKKRMTM